MSDKPCYLVEFDYKAEQQDELSIAKGELLYDAEQEEDGWLRGRNSAGKRGLFPDNFVKPCRLATLRRVDAKQRSAGLEANTAVYAMEPLPAGSTNGTSTIVQIYVPKLSAKFPVPLAYLDIDGVGGGGGSTAHDQQQLPPRPLAGLVPASKSFPPPTSEHQSVGAKQQQQQQQSRPSQSATSTGIAASSGSALLSEKAKLQLQPDLVKVIHAYTGQNPDELSINIGDIIRVTNRCLSDDGWWQGDLHGRVGVFPDNFVEPYSPSSAGLQARSPAAAASAAPARPPVSAAARQTATGGGAGVGRPADSPTGVGSSNGLLAGDHHQPLPNAAAGRPRPAAGKRPPNNNGPTNWSQEDISNHDGSQMTTAATSYSSAAIAASNGAAPATVAELQQEVRRLRTEATQQEREIQELIRFKRAALENIAGLKEEIDTIKKSFHACCVDMDRVKREIASLNSIQ